MFRLYYFMLFFFGLIRFVVFVVLCLYLIFIGICVNYYIVWWFLVVVVDELIWKNINLLKNLKFVIGLVRFVFIY